MRRDDLAQHKHIYNLTTYSIYMERQICLSLRKEMATDIDMLRGNAMGRATLVHNLLSLALKNDELVLKALLGDV